VRIADEGRDAGAQYEAVAASFHRLEFLRGGDLQHHAILDDTLVVVERLLVERTGIRIHPLAL